MKNRLTLLILISLLAISTMVTSSITPVNAASLTRLHTDGKYLKNDYGQIVYLQGAAVADLSWRIDFQGSIEARIDNLIALTDGTITAIRVSISHNPHTFGFALDKPWVFDEALIELKDLLVERGLYFWTTFHGVRDLGIINEFVNDPVRLEKWHLHFVDLFKGVPNFIGVEVWNEPWWKDGSQAQVRSVNEQVYAAVHAADPKALVIVSGFGFSGIEQDYISDPLGHQAVYSWDSYFHDWAYTWYHLPYAEGDYELGRARMVSNLVGQKNIDADLPVINTELGWKMEDHLQAVKDFYDIMNENDNHHATWRDIGYTTTYGLTLYDASTLTPYGEVWAQSLPGFQGEPEPPPSTSIFGNQELDDSITGLNKIQGSVFTAPASGTAASITVGVRSTYSSALKLKAAIYQHSDMSLVAVSEEISVSSQYKGWQTLTFASQPTINAGTEYILVAFSETIGDWRLAIYYDAGASDKGHQQGYGQTYPSFPEVLAPSHTSSVYSIYCTVQVG